VWIEGRDAEHIFLTYYLANTARAMEQLAATTGLKVGRIEVFSSFPLLRWPSALVFLEALWIRLLRRPPLLKRFGSNLVGFLEKPV
jgi:hypothetical protein